MNWLRRFSTMNLRRALMSDARVLQRLPRQLLSRQVVLLAMLLRGATMGVRRAIVQLGGSLVILVMRSVVISRRHITASRSARISCGLPWRVRKPAQSVRAPARYASFPLGCRLFRCARRQCDARPRLIYAVQRLFDVIRAFPIYVHEMGQPLFLTQAAVHRQHLPGDEVARAQEVNDGVGDFLRRTRALSRGFAN